MVRVFGMDVFKVLLVKFEKIVDGVLVWEWFGFVFDEGEEVFNWFIIFFGKFC